MKHQFTQTTNDLRHLLRAINASKHERIIRKSNVIAIRTVTVKAIQKEMGNNDKR